MSVRSAPARACARTGETRGGAECYIGPARHICPCTCTGPECYVGPGTGGPGGGDGSADDEWGG